MKLYHSTPAENRASVERHGLLAQKDQTGYGAVFLTDKGKPSSDGYDTWEVDCTGLELDEGDTTGQEVAEYGNWWMSFMSIPPAQLTLLPSGRPASR